jgi:hypothetical protein
VNDAQRIVDDKLHAVLVTFPEGKLAVLFGSFALGRLSHDLIDLHLLTRCAADLGAVLRYRSVDANPNVSDVTQPLRRRSRFTAS